MAIKRKPKLKSGVKLKKKSATTVKAKSKKSVKPLKKAKKSPAVSRTTKKTKPLKKTVAKKASAKKIVKKPAATKVAKKTAKTTKVKKTPVKKLNVASKVAKTTNSTKPPKSKEKTTKVESTMAVATKISRDRTSAGFLGIPPYKEKAGETYMNEHQRAHFRNILSSWKQALMEEADRTMTHLKHDVVNYPDPSDRASQEEEFTLELRERDRERKLIAKIDEALESIEKEEYGFCEACGVDIGVRRLEARPTATLCIDCKTLDEIREKQTRL